MVACFYNCHQSFIVNMNRSSLATTGLFPPSCFCFFKRPHPIGNGKLFGVEFEFGFGFGFVWQRKGRLRKQVKLVVSAELSKPFSLNFGLDYQNFKPSQSHEQSQLSWMGPVPGDIAEVEAYCRIFRTAERFHIALMNTLCNPLTGECRVSYEIPLEDKPRLEDKIVSVLGCVASLLNKGREDVLSGRSSIMNSSHATDVSGMDDKLPPLAIFRSEMKRCCESLHVALENYLAPDDDRSLGVWRRLQRLKNVCYDSGFPRGEAYPCHTLFANWSPVYLSTSNLEVGSEDSEVAFWRGGQVTEEGLKWLLDKGYKTIIDLRAENVKDNFYQIAINDAIASGKVELVKIPVEVRTAPSMEQVVRFASYVSDHSKRPIYLHSEEGVWRASAMVSRWRQYMARCATPSVSDQRVSSNEMLSSDSYGVGKLQEFSTIAKKSLLEKETEPLQEKLDTRHSSGGMYVDKNKKGLETNGALNGSESAPNRVGFLSGFHRDTDPLQAQVPPTDIFSKKKMCSFLGRRKISPPSFFNYHLKRLETLPVSRDMYISTLQETVNDNSNTDPVPGLIGAGSSNGSVKGTTQSGKPQNLAGDNGKFVTNGSSAPVSPTVNGYIEGERYPMAGANVSTAMYVKSRSQDLEKISRGNTGSVLGEEDLAPIEGDMCASTTGVVRVQSRKKAEMFLVRTDGFSCAREKVTESSLAFTHPSTQQQMLMWKSTPKTVLLLKKLGEALMEEAKEVASFLYYQEKMTVLVEPDVHDIFARIPGFGFVQTFYSQDTSDLHESVDFVACLGGDGVILHASNLFRGAVPPVVSFNLGSLGFLTSHTFEDYKRDLRQVIHGNNTRDGVYITLRMRLRCEIFRHSKAMPGKVFDILNEIVVDRGSNPYLSKIECFEHDRLITKVQGDGVIVATPTGSTAYSTAAGGSMVHPNVPCMLFTPICPHSLSFRPVILPDSARIELKIPEDARSNAWVSFDGKRRQQLSRGDSVRISMSQHPLPTVNKSDQTGDWFHSLIRCLNWNERLDQRAL
ncbi:NAD kinase 2 chloroplastic-like [Quillaja saponaria]|uniref:NAD(+) kinase n=1 Tax=Quillaja saponaria TaxID=32244 RepID=A0AAD7LKX4_QUISA|nr:NAD kinase 2 chloroplastic-like [Quillaja saponaria]